MESNGRLRFPGIATADRASNVTEKRGYRKIAFRFIQCQCFGLITPCFQDNRLEAAAPNLHFQMPQDFSGYAAAARTCSHKHSLDLSTPVIGWSKRTAADRLSRSSCNHEVSAVLFEVHRIDPVYR